MTTLDPITLLAAQCVITIVCGALFTVDVVERRGDRVGRVWSAAFVGSMLVAAAPIITRGPLNISSPGWPRGTARNHSTGCGTTGWGSDRCRCIRGSRAR